MSSDNNLIYPIRIVELSCGHLSGDPHFLYPDWVCKRCYEMGILRGSRSLVAKQRSIGFPASAKEARQKSKRSKELWRKSLGRKSAKYGTG